MKNKHQIIKVVLATMLLVGCQTTQETQVVQSQAIKGDEHVTLDWYINYAWFDTEWGKDIVSQTLTEKTGVSIDFKTPVSEESTKLDSMIDMENLPDIITLGWWEPQVDELIQQDKVYALNVLDEVYGGSFRQEADRMVYEWNTESNGNIYKYPSAYLTPDDYKKGEQIASNQTFLVRKDIYEAIASPDMTTPEGFMNAIRLAAEKYPEVNGEKLIPIGAHHFQEEGNVSFDSYLQNLLAIPYEKDGVFYDRYTDTDYIEWLKVFRQLQEEGYLLDEIYTDQRIQMEERLEKGQYFCMIYQYSDLKEQQMALYNKDPESAYMAVDGPKNSRGEDHVLPGIGIDGWTVTLISKECEAPGKALELISYMMSDEGQFLATMGVEGETFEWVEGKPVYTEEVEQLRQSNRKQFEATYGVDNTYWMLQDTAKTKQWEAPLEAPFRQMEEWTQAYTQYTEQYTIQFEENAKEKAIDEAIRHLWGETLPQLLWAESEEQFDEVLHHFKEARETLGFSRLMEASTRQMNQNKQKLGID